MIVRFFLVQEIITIGLQFIQKVMTSRQLDALTMGPSWLLSFLLSETATLTPTPILVAVMKDELVDERAGPDPIYPILA